MEADRPSAPVGSAGHLLALIRAGAASTRADLVNATGLARSTVAQRLDALLDHNLVVSTGNGVSTGGRPPVTLAFNRSAGVVLAADLGATHSRVAVMDLAGDPLGEVTGEVAIAEGPEPTLDWLERRFVELLDGAGRGAEAVRGIGVGVPGPVEFASARPVSPPIMPGWDGYAVRERFRDAYPAAPLLLDNDVNIMALGEHDERYADIDHLLFVKVGTGIGCGVVAGGRIFRGAQGAAGDIGHVRVADHEDAVCHCGNTGCLEAVAGGAAIARRLSADGLAVANGREVARLVLAGEPRAVRAVREAGRLLGQVLASAVNLFNPSVIVVGGDLARTQGHLLAGVREVVYQRSLPLATRSLRIAPSALEDRAGVRGAGAMILEHVFAPAAVDALLAGAARGVG
jgi:predicted NBD/HSP70 family sugar kinase